ncbi:MAG TPA: hypothetical protein VNA25_25425 [Phycisphaerae bacterium]|nr:hypothetical protein [Phycisphaerae bacterium]
MRPREGQPTREPPSSIERAILRLDTWLDTMRTPAGYGGPVVHWWQDCLHFTGAGLDWRYEGIILGYLNLYERTGDDLWLAKARRAGDDLVRGQLASGNYRNSSFEVNPYAGGTPHEAACDVALLCLARVLKEAADPAWQGYAAAAAKNLHGFIIGVLWDGERQTFRNAPGDPAFVPNKAATIVEALLAWSALSGDEGLAACYARPTLEAIVACQMLAPGDPLDGGIPQRVDKEHADGRYFPFYIARCVPALVQGAALFGDERYQDAARAVVAFLRCHRRPDGSFPQVIYANSRVNRYPQWVAGAADILRALDLVDDGGGDGSREATLNWLLAGLQGPSPRTAHGFAAQVSQARPPALPDFRDLLGVAGWGDKAFRYLAGLVTPSSLTLTPGNTIIYVPCLFQGSEALYREDDGRIEVRRGGELLYRWRKGTAWAKVGPA